MRYLFYQAACIVLCIVLCLTVIMGWDVRLGWERLKVLAAALAFLAAAGIPRFP